MEAINRELIIRAIQEIPDDCLPEIFDFIGYLVWRHGNNSEDQSWFWTGEWQQRYREAKEDLKTGRFKEFDDVEALLEELKTPDESLLKEKL